MSTKHTEGHWSHNVSAVWAGEKMVAAVYGDDPDCKHDARMKANARLIAAAPELLDVLKAMLDDVGRASSLPSAVKARAVIAKATGEQA